MKCTKALPSIQVSLSFGGKLAVSGERRKTGDHGGSFLVVGWRETHKRQELGIPVLFFHLNDALMGFPWIGVGERGGSQGPACWRCCVHWVLGGRVG